MHALNTKEEMKMKKINYFGKEYTVGDDVKWVATNSHGTVMAFTYEPVQTVTGWVGGMFCPLARLPAGAIDWKNSLRKVEDIIVKEISYFGKIYNVKDNDEIIGINTMYQVYTKTYDGVYKFFDFRNDLVGKVNILPQSMSILTTMETKPHPHADLILKYAMIAQYDAEPWKHFEYETSAGWTPCLSMAAFNENVNYRLKPQEPKIQVGQIWVSKEGVEVEVTSYKDLTIVTTVHTLGGNKVYWTFLMENFLQNFKRKE